MRGEAPRRIGAERHPARARATKAFAENAGLLPPSARGARYGGVAYDGRQTPAERRYNPAFGKADLFRLGYFAEYSGHSTGKAVDLTLLDLNADNSPQFDPNKAYADCTADAGARAPEASVDMGTGYDCSDVKAHTAARSITSNQRRWRNVLVAAMAKQGFVNYSKEWWHFSLPGAGGPAYDFPITARMR